MTTVQDFNDAGIALWIEGDKLKFQGARDALLPTVIDQLRLHKEQLRKELAQLSDGRLDCCSEGRPGNAYNHPTLFGRLRTVRSVDKDVASVTESLAGSSTSPGNHQDIANHDMNAIDWWLSRLQNITAADAAVRLLDSFHESEWPDEQLQVMKDAYQPILLRVFSSDSGDYIIDGRKATAAERLQMEKYARGWAVPQLRMSDICTESLTQPEELGLPWTVDTARKLIARYPDDHELWRLAVEKLDQYADAGASGDCIAACWQVLESEWERQRQFR